MPQISLDTYMQYLERTGKTPEPDRNAPLVMSPEDAQRIEEIPSIDVKQFDAQLQKSDVNPVTFGLTQGVRDLSVTALNYAGWHAKKRPTDWRTALALPNVGTGMSVANSMANYLKDTPLGEKIRDSLLAYRVKIQNETAAAEQEAFGPEGPQGAKGWAYGFFRAAPNMLAMIGATVATGGMAAAAGASAAVVATAASAAGMAFTGIQTAVNKAPELEAAGYSQESAEALAQGLGLAVGSLEAIGIGKIAGYVGPWWKRALSGMVAEGLTEFAQSGVESTADKILGLSDSSVGDILRNAVFEMSIGMAYGGLAGAAMVRNKIQKTVDYMVDNKIVETPEQARSFIDEAHIRMANEIINQGIEMAELDIESVNSVRSLIAKANGIKMAMDSTEIGDVTAEAAQAPTVQDLPPEKRIEVQAAVQEIDQTIKNIDNRLDEMMGEPDFDYATVEEALVEKDKLEQSRAKLLSGADIQGKVAVSAKKVAQQRIRGMQNTVKAFNAGMKSARREMVEVKKFLRDHIKNIPAKGKVKKQLISDMLRASESIRSVADLEAKKGYISLKLNESLDLMARDTYMKAIEKRLDAKNVSPDVRRILDKFKEAYEHPMGIELVEIDTQATEQEQMIQELTRLYQEMGQIAGEGDAPLDQIKSISEGVAEMIEIGVAKRKAWLDRQNAIIQNGVDTIVGALEAKGPVRGVDLNEQAVKLDKKLRATFKEMTVNNPMYTNLYRMIDILDMHTASEPGQGPVMKKLNPFVHARVFEAEFSRVSERMWQDFADVYNKGSRKGIDSLARAYERETPYMLHQNLKYDKEGNPIETKRHPVSRSQAIAVYLMSKDAKTEVKLREANWDVESIKEQLAARHEGRDLVFADRLDNMYRSYRARINDVYERATGKPIALIKDYFPLSYVYGDTNADTLGKMVDSLLTGEFKQLDAADTDRLKSRTGSKKMLEIPSALATTMQYMYDMEYFLAYGPYLRNVYAMIENPEVRSRIENREGKIFYSRLKEYFHTIGRGGLAREFRFASINVNRWISKYALSRIGGTIPFDKHFLMQLTGAVSAANEIGYTNMIAEFPSFIQAVRSGEIKELTETKMYKERFGSESAFDPDLRDLQAAMADSPTAKKALRYFLTNVRLGDQIPFTWAAWTEYQKGQKAGLSKAEAGSKALEMASVTNQSVDAYMAPLGAQSTNPLARLVWTFRRMPAQLLNNYLATWQNAINGRVRGVSGKASSGQIAAALVRNAFTYHFLLPLMVETIRTGGDIDEEQLWMSMAFGPIAEMFIVSDIAQIVFNGLWGAQARVRDSMSGTLYSSIIRDVAGIVNSAVDLTEFVDEFTIQELLEATGNVMSIPAGGIPVGDIAREVFAIANPNMSRYTDWRDLLGRGFMYLMDYSSKQVDK